MLEPYSLLAPLLFAVAVTAVAGALARRYPHVIHRFRGAAVGAFAGFLGAVAANAYNLSPGEPTDPTLWHFLVQFAVSMPLVGAYVWWEMKRLARAREAYLAELHAEWDALVAAKRDEGDR